MFRRWFGASRTDRDYARGLEFFHRGELRSAVEAFDECLAAGAPADHPTTALASFYKAEAHARIGRASLAAGEWPEALGEFQRALEIQPTFPDLHFCAALAAYELKEARDALRAATQALEFNRSYLEAAALVYLCHLQLGEGVLSEQTLGRCREMAASREDPLGALFRSREPIAVERLAELLLEGLRRRERIERATSLLEQGFWEEAREAFARLVEMHPRYPDLRVHLAKCHYGLDEPDAAMTELQVALEIRPSLVQANVLMGVIRLARHEVRGAQACFEQALKGEPTSTFARYGLASAAMLLGEPQTARPLAESLAREHPESAAALRLLCFSRIQASDLESTREALLRWTAMAEGDAVQTLDQIAVALDSGADELAGRLAKKLADGAADPATALARARVARRAGDREGAIELLRLGSERLGGCECLRVEAAELALEAGDAAAAVSHLAGLGSRDARSRLLLARAYRLSGRAKQAVELLREPPCLSMEARVELLLARRGNANSPEADEELQELLTSAPLASIVRAQDPRGWCEPFRGVARSAAAAH